MLLGIEGSKRVLEHPGVFPERSRESAVVFSTHHYLVVFGHEHHLKKMMSVQVMSQLAGTPSATASSWASATEGAQWVSVGIWQLVAGQTLAYDPAAPDTPLVGIVSGADLAVNVEKV